MLTSGTCPRRALWRLAQPLARPGPRCRSVAAGRPLTRAKPSAAPVATPSKRQSTPRISGESSRAATKCISDVPGLAKQTLTSLAAGSRAERGRRSWSYSWGVMYVTRANYTRAQTAHFVERAPSSIFARLSVSEALMASRRAFRASPVSGALRRSISAHHALNGCEKARGRAVGVARIVAPSTPGDEK